MSEKEEKMNFRLLLVEDEENIRKALLFILKRYVTDVIAAENGEDGLKKYEEYKPDVIVSDIRMPKKTGLEMLKEIRNIDKDVFAIIMSAYDDSRYLMEAINSGVDSYIVKPIEKDRILGVLKSFYKNKQVKY